MTDTDSRHPSGEWVQTGEGMSLRMSPEDWDRRHIDALEAENALLRRELAWASGKARFISRNLSKAGHGEYRAKKVAPVAAELAERLTN
jgi:hypothetical protein